MCDKIANSCGRKKVKCCEHECKSAHQLSSVPVRNASSEYFSCSNSPFTSHETDRTTKEVDDDCLSVTNGGVTSIRFLRWHFEKPCITLAKNLLGKVLMRRLPSGEILSGRIVETESYLGSVDKACHSFNGKRTERNAAMFLVPGTAYVYSIYGMYFCFNISSLEEGAAVLIRSLEPLQGLATMSSLRSVKRKSSSRPLKDFELCNGPSKLCQSMNINKDLNKKDLATSLLLWVEDGFEIPDSEIVTSKRIGISSAGKEWADKLLRFYVKNNRCVSVRDKAAELSATI